MSDWKQDYLDELKRTTGKVANLDPINGAWFRLVIEGEKAPRTFSSYRKKEIIEFTEILKDVPTIGE